VDVTRNRPNLPHRSTKARSPDATLALAAYRGNNEANRTESSATLLPAHEGTLAASSSARDICSRRTLCHARTQFNATTRLPRNPWG
jgi:hypothetical protein